MQEKSKLVEGVVSGDLAAKLAKSWQGNVCLLGEMKNEKKLVFSATFPRGNHWSSEAGGGLQQRARCAVEVP